MFINIRTPYQLLSSYCLALFLVIFSLFLVLNFLWFPNGLFFIAGGWDGIKLVMSVDLSLGLLFLLVIFRPSKPMDSLSRDLSILALIQLLILSAGVFFIHKAKPLVVVHTFDTFNVLSKDNFDLAGINPLELDGAEAGAREGGWLTGVLHGFGPKVMYVETPDTESAFISSDFSAESRGGRIAKYSVDRYQPIPADLSLAQVVLRGKVDLGSNCIRVAFISNFKRGVVCYDPAAKTFGSFEDGALLNESGQE